MGLDCHISEIGLTFQPNYCHKAHLLCIGQAAYLKTTTALYNLVYFNYSIILLCILKGEL